MADTAVTLVDVEAWRGGGGDGASPPDPAAPSTGAGSPARKTPASLTASTSRSLYSAEDLSEQNPQRSSSAQADPPVTTKKELWSYYLYFFGDTGVNTYLYAPTLLQLLATAAGHRPDDPSQPCDGADANASCFVSFGPIGDISVSSMVLFTQGMSFLLLAVICAFFGALADYADYGRRILLVMTVVAVAAQLVPLAITEPDQWYLMAIFNIIISVSIGATIVYYTAAFPNLAANMPLVRKAQSEAKEAASLLSAEDGTTRAVAEAKMRAAERVTMLARNEISSTSNAALSLGYAVNTAVCLIPSLVLSGTLYNTNISCAVTGIFMMVFAIPWFIFQKVRRNPPLPPGENIATVGWRQTFGALKDVPKLSQTFLYITSYFVLADAQGTTMSLAFVLVVKIVNARFQQDPGLINVYLTIFAVIEGTCGALGFPSFFYVQQALGLSTKAMYQICNFALLAVPIWGVCGLVMDNFGIHTWPEVWFFFLYKFFINPFYAYSATMMSEVIPHGKENLYFSIYGIVGKTSAFMGPIIAGLIINATGNDWSGFLFCLPLTVLSIVLVQLVNVEKSKVECARYLAAEAAATCVPRDSFAPSAASAGYGSSDSYENPVAPGKIA